ncbi:unnamed protein product [Calypogeia fissa]
MVKDIPIVAHRSRSARWRNAGRGAEDLPFCLTGFQQEELSPRPCSRRLPRAQSIRGSSSSRRNQLRRVRCRYTLKRGPKVGLKCPKRPLWGDYCRRHQKSTSLVTPPPPQSALSPSRSGSLCVYHQCHALTLKGLNCSIKAISPAPYCKRHLKYMMDTERRSRLVLPTNNEWRFPPALSSFLPNSFDLSPQHEDGLDLQMKTSSFAEEESLFPICRPCKIITLRNCNLCQSYGCKMRALSVVHEAPIQLNHTIITPLIEDKPSTSNSQPSPRLRTQKCSKTLTLSDILPKLKVCHPGDFGMPNTIPIGTNFRVWDRWWHIKQSHLGFHVGMGLFTVHPIPKGEDLFPYIGPEYDKATFHQIEQVLPEIRYSGLLYWDQRDQSGREVWIDGGIRHSNLAGYINSVHREKDCRKRANVGWELRQNGCQGRISNNVFHYMMTVSRGPIASGEELYSTYDWQGAYEKVQRMRDRIGRRAAVPAFTPDQMDSSNRRFGGLKRSRYTSR